jgi:hypothetical protein
VKAERVDTRNGTEAEGEIMLSSIELPHWLMIGGASLIVIGFLGLAFTRNKEDPESPPEPRPKMARLPKLLDSSRRKDNE